MTNIVGTDYYMAPEVIKGKYDRSCDIWSIGIVAYILLCGYPPFNGDTNRGVFESITKGKLVFPAQAWSNKSGLVKDFITCLLRKDPLSRFTVQEALMHPWIASRTTQCDQESDTKYDDSIVPKMLKPIQNLKTRNPSRIIDKRPSDVPEACPTRIAEIMKEFQKRLTFDEINESGMHLDSGNNPLPHKEIIIQAGSNRPGVSKTRFQGLVGRTSIGARSGRNGHSDLY